MTNVEDVIVADAWFDGTGPADNGSFGSRVVFDRDGLLYVTLGERNKAATAQDGMTHLGKILRVTDDGKVPAGNPFVGAQGYKPEIYSLGHRNPLGLSVHPVSGEIWSTEQGPQGGDEINVIRAGKNYGWPVVSFGRNYDGTQVGEGPWRAGHGAADRILGARDRRFGSHDLCGRQVPAMAGQRVRRRDARVRAGEHRPHSARVLQRPRPAHGTRADHHGLEATHPRGSDGTRRILYAVTDEPLGAMLKIEPAE